MTAPFTGDLATLTTASTARYVWLVSVELTSGTVYLHTGLGALTVDGQSYLGAGGLLSLGGLDQALGGKANKVTLGLSGVDEALREAFNTDFQTEAKGKKVTIKLCFLDEASRTASTVTGNPVTVWTGRVSASSYSESWSEAGIVTTISASCENIFQKLAGGRASLYTDTDQQARFAGDRGFEFVASLARKVVTWPTF